MARLRDLGPKEPTLGRVLGAPGSDSEGLGRLVVTTQPAEQLAPGRVEDVGAVEVELVDERERGLRALDLGHGQEQEPITADSCQPGAEPLPAVQRAIKWLLAMQNSDGGWAAFDRDINRTVLEKVPFADHNAMQDPSCPDITGRVLECLSWHGFRNSHPMVRRAIQYIKSRQEPEGCWFGRWGVNYIYGTMCVLRGLDAIGVDNHEPYVQQAAEWLRSVQNPDGGWGESCASYMDDSLRGRGPSTASQTAWALLALVATGSRDYERSIRRGVGFLIDTQREDGTWNEPYYTGTGFPGYGFGARMDFRDQKTREKIAASVVHLESAISENPLRLTTGFDCDLIRSHNEPRWRRLQQGMTGNVLPCLLPFFPDPDESRRREDDVGAARQLPATRPCCPTIRRAEMLSSGPFSRPNSGLPDVITTVDSS